ncbi:Prefoldin subunit-domain-containing protein [Lophiotrema nucula]|uniref:Prefoldin subunit-domain-containing protein n=1 Tax=Lophiotrema nucula TaxID=690887 RepID=A0A6A5ZF68_9PLEO|nr:Prefoldin subunit-domain-containing protein [Lophiotrema nucula]
MASVADTMESVERRRVQLEENTTKLGQSLQNWKTWEFEYEMLIEEIHNAGSPSAAQMLEIGRELRGTRIKEKEVDELLGSNRKTKRDANQVVDLISKRINYVQQNIATVAKQLDSAEKKLAGTSVLLEPDMANEEGLPLMDIEEELDEDGNIVSSNVSQPGKAAPEIIEALKKSGALKAEQNKATTSNEKSQTSSAETTSGGPVARSSMAPQSSVSASKANPARPTPTKKSVSFADEAHNEPPPGPLTGRAALETHGYNETLADYNFTKGTKVIEIDDDENEIAQYPIIPQGDNPEDAELRRQMLQYGLSEVGQVVAEIDLDTPRVEYSDEEMEDEDYDEDYGEDEDEEDEDKFGRSTRRVLTAEYEEQMRELEKKLNARMLENVGPRPDTHPLAEHADDVRKLVIRKDDEMPEPMDTSTPVPKESAPQKKGVRFADSLDVSPAPQPARNTVEESQSRPAIPTISDSIIERVAPAPAPPNSTSSKPPKVSRFKSSRAAPAQPNLDPLPTPSVPEPTPVPSGPSGRTLASTVVEHEPSASANITPDEFDPVMINREVQQQYHKMRNKFISEQGGFKPSQEEIDDPIMEEVDGKAKKVSRFKAARLKADGM